MKTLEPPDMPSQEVERVVDTGATDEEFFAITDRQRRANKKAWDSVIDNHI